MGNGSEMKLVCHRCGAEFVFSQSEQEFYQQKGFSLPTHCKECRQMRRTQNSLVCASCQQKIEKLSDVYCVSCAQAPRIESEAEIRRLQDALQGATARLNCAEVEVSRLAEELKARVAALESEKANIVADAGARFNILEEEKKAISAEARGRLETVESENGALGARLTEQTRKVDDLEKRLAAAEQELEESRRYRVRLDSLEPALQSLQTTLREVRQSQEKVDGIMTRVTQEPEPKNGHHDNPLVGLKRILGFR